MGRNLKRHSERDVLVRKDGRRVVRCFSYLPDKIVQRVKVHCFETGESFSSFVEKSVQARLRTVRRSKRIAA